MPVKSHTKFDYAMGVQLKELADTAPGCAILVVHHTRKQSAEDFIDTLSGTQGIAGSVDFVLVLERKRRSNDAILKVVGRDIEEGEYALTADHGVLWRLSGENLSAASNAADERRDQDRLGPISQLVLNFVNSRQQTKAADLEEELGVPNKQARQVLNRLAMGGSIVRESRGVYRPHATVRIGATAIESSEESEALCFKTQEESGFHFASPEKVDEASEANGEDAERPYTTGDVDTSRSEGIASLDSHDSFASNASLASYTSTHQENSSGPSSEEPSGESFSLVEDYNALKKRLLGKNQDSPGY